jgi:ABC-type Fe3+ transport system permease subunit/sugar lactone lactonase YvrE
MNWVLLKNSLMVSGLTTLLAVGFGALAALWVACLDRRWQAFLAGAALLVLALPPFLLANCWLHYLGHAGVWRSWLSLNLFSLGGTVWILALWLWPITFLAVWSAWQRLESAHLESDMALTGTVLVRVLLFPLARPALAQAALLTFILALNHFAIPAILQVKVFPAEIWVRFSTSFDTLGALQLSWPLVLGPTLLLLWLARRPVAWPHLQPPVPPRLLRQQVRPGWFLGAGALATVIYLLGAGLPLFQLLSAPRTWSELPGALAAGSDAVWNSFAFAALAASLVIGLSLLQCGAPRGREAQGALVQSKGVRAIAWLPWLPFLVPGVLLGMGLIFLLNRPALAWFYHSVAIVLLALGIRYLALGWTAVSHALDRSDPRLLEVARLHGASRLQLLRYAHWPQVKSQVLAAWYIIFLLCLWDVETIVLLWPPGAETLALRIFNLLHYGHNAQVNALCLALLGLAAAPLLGWLVWRRFRRLGWGGAARAGCLAAGGLWLCGCAPEYAPHEAPLRSQLFDRVEIIGTRGAGVGQVNKPRSVAVDPMDNLYVVDMTGRVQKFDSNGVFVLQWQMPETDIGRAKGLCRDREGNIVVNEPHYARVNHYSPAGRLVFQWGRHGPAPGELGFPRAVAVNSQNEIIVSEYGANERVQRFRLPPTLGAGATVEFLNAFGERGGGPGQFNRPEGLCVDAQDRIYVADSCNHRIQVFTREGRFLRAYGRAGRGPGQLSYPYDICVDSRGFQYVCEFGNSRIQVFDADDRPVEMIGGPGAEPGRFSNPWGVALDSAGNLYVADSQNHRIQKLKRSRPYGRASSLGTPVSIRFGGDLPLALGVGR